MLRTLLSIVFKWGTEPLLTHVVASLPEKSNTVVRANHAIIDLTNTPEEFRLLTKMTLDIFVMLFPNGIESVLPSTLVTTTIVSRHLPDVVCPGLLLGWMPKSLHSEVVTTVDELRPMILRLLRVYVVPLYCKP
jgi:hypothetical protein